MNAARNYLCTYLRRNGYAPHKTLRATLAVHVGDTLDTGDTIDVPVIFERKGADPVTVRREDGEPVCRALRSYADAYLDVLPTEF